MNGNGNKASIGSGRIALVLAAGGAMGLLVACSTPPSAGGDGGVSTDAPIAPDAVVVTDAAVATDAALAHDASLADAMEPADLALQACLPPPGVMPSLGPIFELAHPGTPIATGDVGKFAITPDGSTVVFIADTEDYAMKRLYATPIEGGAITRLSHNEAWIPGQDVEDFEITPDGARVVYRGDVDQLDISQLYSVPIGGGAVQTLTPAGMPSFGAITISSDSAWVVFVSSYGPPSNSREQVHSVPAAGGSINILSHNIDNTFSDIRSVRISPDASRVVYLGDTEVEGSDQIYSVPIGGGVISEISPSTAGDSSNEISRNFIVSPDSGIVVYVANLEGDDRFRLYRAAMSGGAASILAEEANGMPLAFVGDPAMGDSDRVFYRGGFDSSVGFLFVVSLSTGLSELLSPGVAAQGFNAEKQLSPDGQYAVFPARSGKGVDRIYSVPSTGGPLTTLSQNIFEVPEHRVFDPVVTSDSRRVVYYGNADPDGVERFYAVCIEGGAPLTLTPNLGSDTDLRPSSGVSAISDDGRYAMVAGPMLVAGVVQLFVADMLTEQILEVSSNTSDPNLGIDTFAFSPDSSWIVFTGDQESDAVVRLYSREVVD